MCIVIRWQCPCGRRGRAAEFIRRRPGSTRPPAGWPPWQEWLAGHAVTLAAMEATGVYWKPVYYALEGRFLVWLCNAHHVKNVPGRKTDMSDAG